MRGRARGGRTASGERGWASAALLALLAYAASLPLMRLAVWRVLGQRIFLSEIVFAVCLLTAIPAVLSRRRWRRLGGFEVWAGAYLLAASIATVLSQEPALSAGKLVGVAYLVAVGALTHLVLDEPWKRRRLVTVWLAASALTAMLSMVGVAAFYLGLDRESENLFLRHYGSLPPGPYPRVAALFLNVNMLCNYLLVSFVLAWQRWMERRRLWPYGLLLVGLALAALFTFSTGLGGLLLVGGVLAAGGRTVGAGGAGWRRRLLLGAGIAGAAIVLVAGMIAPGAEGEMAPSLRVRTWQGALETFGRHPVAGRGLGLPVADVEFRVASGRTIHFTDAHNVWLSLAAQTGVIGVAALAGLVVWSLRRARAPAAGLAAGEPSPRLLALALGGALLYHGLTASLEDARHLWLLLGLMAAAGGGKAGGDRAHRSGEPPPPAGSARSTIRIR